MKSGLIVAIRFRETDRQTGRQRGREKDREAIYLFIFIYRQFAMCESLEQSNQSTRKRRNTNPQTHHKILH
jgi:hypothetical protein